MSYIKGNKDGLNGRNDTYQVRNRLSVPRATVVREVEKGLHPGVHVVKDGYKYIRDNPDTSKRDNVN